MDKLPETVALRFRPGATPIARSSRASATTMGSAKQRRPAGPAARRPKRRAGPASPSRPKGDGRVNQHFGHAKEFQIYEASAEGVRFIGHRKVDAGYCGGGGDAALDEIIKALAGVEAVLCAKIGECPAGQAARRRHHDERRVGL